MADFPLSINEFCWNFWANLSFQKKFSNLKQQSLWTFLPNFDLCLSSWFWRSPLVQPRRPIFNPEKVWIIPWHNRKLRLNNSEKATKLKSTNLQRPKTVAQKRCFAKSMEPGFNAGGDGTSRQLSSISINRIIYLESFGFATPWLHFFYGPKPRRVFFKGESRLKPRICNRM